VPLLRTTLPPELSSICDLDSIRLNLRVLLFTFAIAGAAGVISGLMPALHQSRTDLNGVLKETSGRATTRVGQRLRGIFVVAELALSLILLINAGLMVKGFLNVASQHPNIFTAAPLAMAFIAGLACIIPARRAMRIDPMEALHYE